MATLEVASTTERDALEVTAAEVGSLAVWVQNESKLYRPKSAGTGSAIWESGEALQDVVDDTTPQLGGALDVQTYAITTSTANGSVTLTPIGTGGVIGKGYVIVGKAEVALSDGANIATDASLGNVFGVTLAGNRTLDNPTNLVVGGRYTWKITQDGTGSRTLAYGNKFLFAGGAPTLTTTAAALDVITGIYDGTSLLCDVLLDVQA